MTIELFLVELTDASSISYIELCINHQQELQYEPTPEGRYTKVHQLKDTVLVCKW